MKYEISENNFDLIRLFAALQVAVIHVLSYISPTTLQLPIFSALETLSGVPIFFFISGFLISRAFEKTKSIHEYARNRSLRIFPALHVCVLLNLLMVAATGYFVNSSATSLDILLLYLAKTTIFQFYNPDFMRDFGDGVLNGSLWTICVELQFYFLTPIIYRLLLGSSKKNNNVILVTLIAGSIACNRLLYNTPYENWSSNYWKVARVSFLPWIYMFLTGVLVQINFEFFKKTLKPYLLILILPIYIAFAIALSHMGYQLNNSFSPLLFFPLAFTVLVAAFTSPVLARLTLRGNDISYGVYIYHVPIMNMFLYYGYRGNVTNAMMIILLTVVAALASWLIIERPSLKKKRKASRLLTTPR